MFLSIADLSVAILDFFLADTHRTPPTAASIST
jgi:hypothetical protein